MSIEVQLRRGTLAENNAFVGQEGELVYTTDTKDLYAHDGITAGGQRVGIVSSIADNAVSFAKIEEIAGNTILGNNTGGSSDIIELTTTQTRTLLNVADGATANSSDATLLARANHTGTQTASTISDFDTEVANNSAVAANTAKVGLTNGSVDSDKLSTTLDFGSIV
jgi:hypothetical protein